MNKFIEISIEKKIAFANGLVLNDFQSNNPTKVIKKNQNSLTIDLFIKKVQRPVQKIQSPLIISEIKNIFNISKIQFPYGKFYSNGSENYFGLTTNTKKNLTIFFKCVRSGRSKFEVKI